MSSHPAFIKYALLIFAFSPASFAAEDFSLLKSHWNFDEGRDWHNMEFPFRKSVAKARDAVGTNDLSLSKTLNPVKAWASGRQFSGIRFDAPGQLLRAPQPLNELKSTCALSYWIKTTVKGGDSLKSSPGIMGDADGMVWGVISDSGRLAVSYEDKVVASTEKPVNDDQWHHVVIMRNAETGAIHLFLDGVRQKSGKTLPGELKGEYLGFGSVKGGASFQGVLDQVHLFGKILNPDTITALNKNHAPKAYGIESLISKGKPSVTGSILHLYTFDPDQDAMGVSRFGQGKYGTVAYNKDGTFTYTAGAGFPGKDTFSITLTDGKGGYCETAMTVKDETTVPRTPVTKFTAWQELPSSGGSDGSRKPVAIDWDGDKRADILVAGNNKVLFYKNSSTRQKPGFDAPVEVKDSSGKLLESNGISLLASSAKARPSLVVRESDKTLSVYEIKPSKDGSSLSQMTGKIKDDQGADFVCPTDAFSFGDFDNDGLPDLLVGDGGGIYVYKNVGSAREPKFKAEREQVISNSYNLAPWFADLNGDGKIDLMHGINWGSLHLRTNLGGKNILDQPSETEIILTDKDGKTPMKDDATLLRRMNGSLGAVADFNGDGIPDLALGAYNNGIVGVAYGVSPDAARNNLALIERLYKEHPRDLGKALEANDQELLKLYRNLSREWITWAVSQPSVAGREKAYQDLKAHIRKFDFLKRKPLDAWVKRDKEGKVTEIGPMHHIPGIFVMNWATLHCMLPDSAKHRMDVADALGLKGLDREQYLKSGLAVADNNKCTDGQILSITDMMKYHPRVMFPDDHISIDQNFGDGRDAISYFFESAKNTFGNDVGGAACEMAEDSRDAAEKYLGKGAATGDYFTLVMAHEVCHSMDAYINRRANKDLARRWADMIIFAGNNGGANEILAQDESGWIDWEKTKKLFQAKNLWDGSSSWEDTWRNYWDNCEYKDLTFMRGNIGWFIAAKQETLATQANHHWAGSEARLVGAIDRYKRGYKANINEVVLYIDFQSGGLNEVSMYNFEVTQKPNRVIYKVDKAWLERNDKGYVTKITIGPRVYEFDVDDGGRVTAIKNHPFMKEMGEG